MAYHDQDRVKEILCSKKFERRFPNTLTDPGEILAEYGRIRERGYVISDGETLSPSAVGVGVPVFNGEGIVKGCMVIAFIKDPDYEAKIPRYLEVLSENAEELSKYMP